MNQKAPAFQWYPKDILSSARVQVLSMEEECAYRRLIDYCWLNESVPSDPVKASRLVGKGCSPEMAAAALELFEPHPSDPGMMIHPRLEEEKKKQEDHRKVRKAAAESRWSKSKPDSKPMQEECKTDALALHEDMQNDALHLQSSSSNNSPSENTPLIPPGGWNEWDGVFPVGVKKKSTTHRKSKRVLRSNLAMMLVGSWFGRKQSTMWNIHEAEILQMINPSKDDLSLMALYYESIIPPEKDFRRRNLATLLSNWDGELDRAVKFLNQ